MEKPQNPIKKLFSILNDRLLLFFVMCALSFLYITNILFEIQIVMGETHYSQTTTREPRDIHIPPERGNIYDRFGRPLAVNIATHSIMFDPSINLSNPELNHIMLNLLNLLERNGEVFFDVLPITEEEPFEFNFSGSNPEGQRARFFGREGIAVEDKPTYDEYGYEIYHRMTVDALFDVLIQRFAMESIIEEQDLTPLQIRNLISLRYNLFNHRYRRFVPITISMDVGLDTIISIEEDPRNYAAAFITTQFLRYYPAGIYLSHIVGYIDSINENHDLDYLIQLGYSPTDLIGHTGMEAAFERELRGRPGREEIYINSMGRRLGVTPNSRIEPVRGSDIFLTIDKYLQMEAFHILRETLVDTIIARMTVNHHTEPMLTIQQVLSSLVAANNIEPRLIFEAESGSVSYLIKNIVLDIDPEADVSNLNGRNQVNRTIASAITDNTITPNQIIVLLYEQGIIGSDPYSTLGSPGFTARALSGGAINARNIFIEALRSGEITPQMTNVDPSTGSLVLVDVNTGEVLASVNYPTFDPNNFITNRNNAYISSLFNDPTSPLMNRAFFDRRAPGSVFKMITGIAGLEYGVITPTETIRDQVEFTRAGSPYPESWSSVSLGNLTYSQAIAISSNYFFYETSFRLGEFGEGYSYLSGIHRLNTYMRAFGLNDRSGVEIGEHMWNSPDSIQMASPALQDFRYGLWGWPMRTWTTGDTVRVAIGQQQNAYTPATMARFTAGIASRGNMVDLRLLDRIISDQGTFIARTIPFDMGVEISDSTWEATHQGMLWVTRPDLIRPWNSGSTLPANVFASFPFDVAAKTGTAQENPNRLSHTTFNAFAPAHDPQVAIYVIIPFGATGTVSPSASSTIARDVFASYFGLNDIEQEEPNGSQISVR